MSSGGGRVAGLRTRVGTVWRGLVLFVAVGLLVACTPSSGVSPSPTPTVSAPPVSPSPTENAIERRERLHYAAAEKAYRAFRAEYGRVLEAGGATEATKVMKKTAGGSYLAEFVSIIRAYDRLGYRQEGQERIVYIRPIGHAPNRVGLDVCENSVSAITYDSDNKVFGKGEIRTAQLDVRKIEGNWKVVSASGRKVKSCQ